MGLLPLPKHVLVGPVVEWAQHQRHLLLQRLAAVGEEPHAIQQLRVEV